MRTCNRILSGASLLGMALSVNGAPAYEIERIGFSGAGYERSDGYYSSSLEFLNQSGHAAGYSERYAGTTSLGRDAWLFDGATTLQIGLSGTDYERSDGYRYGVMDTLNQAGQVAGASMRYAGSNSLGQDAWLYNGSHTVRLGFTGTGYEQSDGFRYSYVHTLNEAGQVLGGSNRYSGTTDLGRDAWLHDDNGTVQLGFLGAGYERNNGYRASHVQFLNETGYVAGNSERYSGGTNLGVDAWLYTGGGTVQLGLTGVGYEHSGGSRYSYARLLNDAGHVAGDSRRYSATTAIGQDAWLFDGSSTVQLGLTGAGYERSDGGRTSNVGFLNEAGQVAGSSERYGGWTNLGRDAWLYDGNGMVQLGFTGTGYEQKNGYRVSYVNFLNEAGQVAGSSERYSGPNHLGTDAWLYDGNGTVQLGFTGAGYEGNDGNRTSYVQFMNEAGQAAGVSARHNGISALGWDAWLYDGSGTVQLGLTGAGYEKSDGTRGSSIRFLNEAGQVAGASSRFNATTSLGMDAWLYDAALEQLVTLSLSTRKADGYAFSEVAYLGDDGLVLGRYKLFDPATDDDLGYRAFVFSGKDGLFDLSSLVLDLVPDGWDMLADAVRANGFGDIGGHGTLGGSTGTAAYILTPVPAPVPLPGFGWLMAGVFSGLGAKAMKRKVRVLGGGPGRRGVRGLW